MRVRRWIYVGAGAAMVIVIALVAYDQLLVEYGDDDSYLLGKATTAVTWILTLATPFALFDFFRWLKASQAGTPTRWWAAAGVLAGFFLGWFYGRRWS